MHRQTTVRANTLRPVSSGGPGAQAAICLLPSAVSALLDSFSMIVLLFLLATAFPSESRTSWMEPEAFHVRIGMSESKALKTLRDSGWTVKRGKGGRDWIVEYEETRTVTLVFNKGRLTSARFALVDFPPEVRAAFNERKSILKKAHGEPSISRARGTTLLYDRKSPNIMAVISTDARTEFGKKGLAFFVVRYFEPPPLN